MKKLFLSLLTVCLAMPFSAWADTSEHEADEKGEHSGALENGDVWDDEQEEELGKIVPSTVQLEYKILSTPSGTAGETDYVNGTVELEGVYYSETGITGALYIPHEIQVVTVNGLTATVDLYTVVSIAASAFRDDETISAVTIPYTVTQIGDYAFDDCEALASLAFAETEAAPSELTTIGKGAFMGAPIASLGLPAAVTSLEEKAFKDCSQIPSLVVPAALTTIAKNAFDNCGKLATVTLSGNTTLGDKAFGDCGAMTAVVFSDEHPTEVTGGAATDADPFGGDETDDIILYAPTGYAAVYANSAWDDLVFDDEELSWNFFDITIATAAGDGEGNYYSTYYVDEEGYTISDGTVYAVTAATLQEGSTSKVDLTFAAINGIIPENTAILVENNAYGTYYFYKPYEGGSEATVSGNMLYGSSEATTTNVDGNTEDYYFYKLSQDANFTDYSVGFYYGVEGGGAFEIPAYKAWLAIPKSILSEEVSGISFKKEEGEATGITAVESATESAKKGIYTISGVRVNDMSKAGLYIVDGKKVLVK